MKLYQGIRDFGKRVLLIGGLATILSGCGSEPVLEQNKDLTGDGIPDVMVELKDEWGNKNRWLFIGKGNGIFVRTKEPSAGKSTKYFKDDEGKTYFFDGENYKLSPEQN